MADVLDDVLERFNILREREFKAIEQSDFMMVDEIHHEIIRLFLDLTRDLIKFWDYKGPSGVKSLRQHLDNKRKNIRRLIQHLPLPRQTYPHREHVEHENREGIAADEEQDHMTSPCPSPAMNFHDESYQPTAAYQVSDTFATETLDSTSTNPTQLDLIDESLVPIELPNMEHIHTNAITDHNIDSNLNPIVVLDWIDSLASIKEESHGTKLVIANGSDNSMESPRKSKSEAVQPSAINPALDLNDNCHDISLKSSLRARKTAINYDASEALKEISDLEQDETDDESDADVNFQATDPPIDDALDSTYDLTDLESDASQSNDTRKSIKSKRAQRPMETLTGEDHTKGKRLSNQKYPFKKGKKKAKLNNGEVASNMKASEIRERHRQEIEEWLGGPLLPEAEVLNSDPKITFPTRATAKQEADIKWFYKKFTDFYFKGLMARMIHQKYPANTYKSGGWMAMYVSNQIDKSTDGLKSGQLYRRKNYFIHDSDRPWVSDWLAKLPLEDDTLLELSKSKCIGMTSSAQLDDFLQTVMLQLELADCPLSKNQRIDIRNIYIKLRNRYVKECIYAQVHLKYFPIIGTKITFELFARVTIDLDRVYAYSELKRSTAKETGYVPKIGVSMFTTCRPEDVSHVSDWISKPDSRLTAEIQLDIKDFFNRYHALYKLDWLVEQVCKKYSSKLTVKTLNDLYSGLKTKIPPTGAVKLWIATDTEMDADEPHIHDIDISQFKSKARKNWQLSTVQRQDIFTFYLTHKNEYTKSAIYKHVKIKYTLAWDTFSKLCHTGLLSRASLQAKSKTAYRSVYAPPFTGAKAEEVLAKAKDPLHSMGALAKEYGISKERMKRFLVKHGIKTLNTKEKRRVKMSCQGKSYKPVTTEAERSYRSQKIKWVREQKRLGTYIDTRTLTKNDPRRVNFKQLFGIPEDELLYDRDQRQEYLERRKQERLAKGLSKWPKWQKSKRATDSNVASSSNSNTQDGSTTGPPRRRGRPKGAKNKNLRPGAGTKRKSSARTKTETKDHNEISCDDDDTEDASQYTYNPSNMAAHNASLTRSRAINPANIVFDPTTGELTNKS